MQKVLSKISSCLIEMLGIGEGVFKAIDTRWFSFTRTCTTPLSKIVLKGPSVAHAW
jgi:hypothetical protein